jgi:hypothetical protein
MPWTGLDGVAYLYGSRVAADKRGGDIDLLVLSRAESPYRMSQAISRRFRMDATRRLTSWLLIPAGSRRNRNLSSS